MRNRQVSSFQVRPEGQYPHQYVDRATLMRRLLPYLESNHSMTGRPLSTYFLDFLSMTEKNEEKVLTDGSSCGNITLALNSTAPTESDARVVELVDSLASGASARKGVRVRLPPRAPQKRTRRKSCPFLWTPRAEGPLRPSGFQCSGRQSRPCAEVLPGAKRSYGAPAPPARRPVGWFPPACPHHSPHFKYPF